MSEPSTHNDVETFSDSNRFVAWFGVGALLMLLFKTVIGAPQLVVTIVPVTVMGVYFYQLWLQTKLSISSEKAGDNIYYLGFLFTLCSLGLALYEFGAESNNKVSLIGDFAIALATTILGVLGRVWLGQGEKQVDDYEREARASMTEAMDSLRSELDQSRESLAGFATATLEMLKETREAHREQMEADRERLEQQFVSSLDSMSKTLAGAVTEGAQSLSSNFELLSQGVSDQVSTFQDSVSTVKGLSDNLVLVLNDTLTSFKNLPDLQDIISDRMSQLVKPVELAAKAMEESLQSQANLLQTLPPSMSRMGTTTEEASQAVATLSAEVKEFVQSLDLASNKHISSLNELQNIIISLSSTLTGIDEGVAKLSSVPATISRQLESLEPLLQRAESSISGTLKQVEDSSSSTTLAVSQIAKDREQVLESLKNSTTAIDAQVVALSDQVEVVSQALVAAAKFIRSEAL